MDTARIAYTDAMCDIETTHTSPDRGAILQIAAVKFNLENDQVCPVFFNKSLTIPPHRHWSEGTRQFWAKQPPHILKGIMQRAEPWRQVMDEFQTWGFQDTVDVRFWAKPTHFDHSFISSYFTDAEMDNPFHYRRARDMNSYFEGLFEGHENKDAILRHLNDMPFEGDLHNALSDTLHQLKVLFEAKRIKKEGI